MKFSTKFINKLQYAKRLVFFTGAGISAESGISTFRGVDGIWNKMKPEELANIDGFMKNPDLVWHWYQHRRQIVHDSKPNAGHVVIAELENYYDVTVVTQNVDNLHRRAGSSNVFELHGNIERNFCIDCKTPFSETELNLESSNPKCKNCGGRIRPDVVWFGEMLPQDQFSGSQSAADSSDICFIVGTSGLVYPAAYIPIEAKQAGAFLVEINIENTEMSRFVDESFIGKSASILPEILTEVKKIKT
ncbi:MAG: NAD-dependent deacylase [Melioribacteraceae bacterium]